MAPRKPTAGKKPRALPNVKKSSDRVVKRPARGFHRFRDGTLNMTPKGGEKELVKTNQESCLLRLPAEIRNQIWKYSIGGRTIRQSADVGHNTAFIPEPSERPNAFALLRVCRQIYAETALHPITTNVFQVSDCSELRKATKSFRKYQLAHITGVRVELNDLHFLRGYELYLRQQFGVHKLNIFPNLRSVHFCVYGSKYRNYTSQSDCFAFLHEKFGDEMLAAGYGMVVEKMDIDIHNHSRHWYGLPPV